MKIGYARVSTQDQHLSLQKDALLKDGCETVYEERASGKNTERPQLNIMLEKMRRGDTLVVWKLDRLGRSLKDLVNIVTQLQARGIKFKSLTDSIDTGTATGRFTFNIFASLAEFERDIIRERTMAGLQAARARGRKGGRPRGITAENLSKAKTIKFLYDQQQKTIAEIARDFGLSRATCYRYLEIANSIDKNESGNTSGG